MLSSKSVSVLEVMFINSIKIWRVKGTRTADGDCGRGVWMGDSVYYLPIHRVKLNSLA